MAKNNRFVRHKVSCRCPKVSFKLSSGVTWTNVETQSWTVVTGLAASSPVTPPLFLIQKSGQKHVKMIRGVLQKCSRSSVIWRFMGGDWTTPWKETAVFLCPMWDEQHHNSLPPVSHTHDTELTNQELAGLGFRYMWENWRSTFNRLL